MNRDNLTKLVDGLIGLRQDPEEAERFTMEVWARTNSCGTFGCAIGTAAVKGWISGLSISHSYGLAPVFVVDGKQWHAWEAVKAAFDLTHDEAQWLFSRRAYPERLCWGSPALDTVITRIAGVLAEGFPEITSAMLKKFPVTFTFWTGCNGPGYVSL